MFLWNFVCEELKKWKFNLKISFRMSIKMNIKVPAESFIFIWCVYFLHAILFYNIGFDSKPNNNQVQGILLNGKSLDLSPHLCLFLNPLVSIQSNFYRQSYTYENLAWLWGPISLTLFDGAFLWFRFNNLAVMITFAIKIVLLETKFIL